MGRAGVLGLQHSCASPQLQSPKARVLDKLAQCFEQSCDDVLQEIEKLSEYIRSPQFQHLPEHDQLRIVLAIGHLPCLRASLLTSRKRLYCVLCDEHGQHSSGNRSPPFLEWPVLFEILCALSATCDRKSSVAIAVLVSLRRFLTHYCLPREIGDGFTKLFSWALAMLGCESREHRIAASRTIPLLIVDEYAKRRVVSTVSSLQVASVHSVYLAETCIMTWTEIGKNAHGDDLNFVLIKLIAYLGSNNDFLLSLACHELNRLASMRRVSSMQLLSPFWDTLSIVVFEPFDSRTLHVLAELLSTTVRDVCERTQSFVLPYLVREKQVDAVQHIAKVLNVSTFELCSSNILPIVAVLLTHSSTDPVREAINCLVEFSEKFSETFMRGKLFALIRENSVSITVDILMMYTDEDQERDERDIPIFNTIRILADADAKKRGNSYKESNLLNFFNKNILGIFCKFSDMLHKAQSATERVRCIRGIAATIRLASAQAMSAKAQIVSCLQGSMEESELQAVTLGAWINIVEYCGDDEVEKLLPLVLSILCSYWASFDEPAKQKAKTLIGTILRVRGPVLKKLRSSNVPLRALNVPELRDMIATLSLEFPQSSKPAEICQDLIARCDHENFVVVQEALLDLRELLVNERLSTLSMTADLLNTLIEVCHRYSETKPWIARTAAECIGRIGMWDVSKLKSKSKPTDLVLLFNFQSLEENIDFVITLMNKYIVPAFQSSTDPKHQVMLAFAMQELLKFCGLNATTVVEQDGDGSGNWNSRLSDAARATLTPLLSSRYSLEQRSVFQLQYPLFSKTTEHRTWVQDFTADLLNRGSLILAKQNSFPTADRVDLLFIFSKVIHNQDVRIAAYLLPFIVQFMIVMGTDVERKIILDEILLVLNYDSGTNERVAMRTTTCQVVFSVLDYMMRWQRARRKKSAERARRNKLDVAVRETSPTDGGEESIKCTEVFLRQIPVELIANRALETQSYARALFYYEQHLREVEKDDKIKAEDILNQLQYIYSKLDDPDSVQGVSSLFLSSTLEQQVRENEAIGRWDLALNCHEAIAKKEPGNVQRDVSIARCLRELNQYDSLLNKLNCNKATELQAPLADLGIESSWICENWESLRTWVYTKSAQPPSFSQNVGAALLCVKDDDIVGFYKALCRARGVIASNIAQAGSLILKECRTSLFQLHVLADIEMMALFGRTQRNQNSDALLHGLDTRLDNFNGSYTERRYLLNLRQTVLKLVMPDDNQELQILMQHAKSARKAQQYAQAYSFVLSASAFDSPFPQMEYARLLWNEGDRRKALQKLETAIDTGLLDVAGPGDGRSYSARESLSSGSGSAGRKKNTAKGKALLRYARWFDESNQGEWSVVLQNYRAVIKECGSLESGYYYLGKYYLKIMDAQAKFPKTERNEAYVSGNYHKQVIVLYCKALRHGSKFVHQTLAKLLTLWLDFATEDYKHPGSHAEALVIGNLRRKHLKSMTDNIQKHFPILPRYIFFTALSQIISRICQSDLGILGILESVLTSLAMEYPAQSLWRILTIEKHNDKARSMVGKEIARKVKALCEREGPERMREMASANHFIDSLISLCHVPVQGSSRMLNLRTKGLITPFNACLPSLLVMPVQANMAITWPQKGRSPGDGEHAAFASTVTVVQIYHTVEIMSSMQKPKKIKLLGSDGRDYLLLCKPLDDLRKDARVMELNNMINMLLEKDAEGQKRGLDIMTYAVTVLKEDCGIIEWVSNTKTMRDVVTSGYNARGIVPNITELRALLDDKKGDPCAAFVNKVLPKFPPVLYEWFIENFPVPTLWLESRTAFACTAAVMSMVGYVFGLGDRHCENILFHEDTGQVLHVDFSCLFWKGLDLEVPERVPFRLTNNLVDALGPAGYNGVFRRACEITLRILRENEDVLLPSLETFLHDKLVDWSRHHGAGHRGGGPTSPEEAFARVRARVRGAVVEESFPLSIGAQVDALLVEATDPRVLCRMYIGWSPMW
ncbi:uncharacterized protein V1518DRAFT_420696 [Limtongia smithiae]|uniref:uncharacterized protein n=1 Tax=Limtongia smithiae TaxID=1125753 RepID=UPI0034CFBF12